MWKQERCGREGRNGIGDAKAGVVRRGTVDAVQGKKDRCVIYRV